MSIPSYAEAKAILQSEINKLESPIELSLDAHDGPRVEARSLTWWRKGEDDTESATTDRNIAYLRAYRRIAGGRPLWAVGIPLAKRRIYLDRSIMRRLERENYVEFVEAKEPYFQITPKGRELIAE